ncbi:hypothetical protein JW968_05765 [Candidatus Woesearchaeota archaeon]|nr:hypothetical protein [Candidatus Woesearchaeota archaeon]
MEDHSIIIVLITAFIALSIIPQTGAQLSIRLLKTEYYTQYQYEDLFRIDNRGNVTNATVCYSIIGDGPINRNETQKGQFTIEVNKYKTKGTGEAHFRYPGQYNVTADITGTNISLAQEINVTDITKENCNISLSIIPDQTFFLNEKISYKFGLGSGNLTEFPYIIEYWIDDHFNKTYKKKLNTTNTNKKSYQPKEREKIFMIKARLYVLCNNTGKEHDEKIIGYTQNIPQEQCPKCEKCPACTTEEKAQQTNANKIWFNYTTADEHKEDIKTNVTINNNKEDHIFEVWSYVYRGSKVYSGEKEDNKVSILVEKGTKKTIQLENRFTGEAGDYKIKVQIKRDDRKTSDDYTKEIKIMQDKETQNKETQKCLTQRQEPYPTKYCINREDITVYKAKNARDNIAQFMIAFLAILSISVIISKDLMN